MSLLRTILFALAALVAATAAHAQIVRIGASSAATAGGGAASVSVATPAGTATDDVMVAVVAVRGNPQSINVPAGWTAVDVQESVGSFRQRAFWRVAVGGEPASHTFTWTASNRGVAAILTYRGADTVAPVNASAAQTAASSAAITAPSVTTTVTNTVLVGFFGIGHAAAGFTLPSPAMTRVFAAGAEPTSGGGPNGARVLVTEEPWAAVGATGARAVTADQTAANAGRMVALRLPPAIDHFSISHAGSGVACETHDITITAHDAAHLPVDAEALLVSLSTSNARGTWTGIAAGGGTLSDPVAGDGAATYQFALASNSVTLQFRYANLATSSETFGFNVSGGGFSETSGVASGSDDPSFTMAQAGFRFRNATDGNDTLPAQISGKPSNSGFNAKTIRLQAINTDTVTGSCTSLLANQTQTIDLGAECNSPAACTASQASINGTGIATSNDNGSAGASSYSPVSLAFNAASEADTVIVYPDAGQISLHARYDVDPGVAGFEAFGSSNPFIVRPFGLAFPGVNHSSTAAGTLIGAAGDPFTMAVQAYQWAAGEDVDNDGVPDTGVNITDNGTVPNFAATATVAVPLGGNLPGFADGALARGAGCAGAASIALAGGSASAADWCYSEVGNALFTASVTDYLAPGVTISGNSGLDGDAAGGYVGRFKPKHFAVIGAPAPTLTNREALACASTFTYMNEGLRLGFTLQAQNTQNARTSNYTGAYAKLDLSTAASLGLGARSGATDLTPRVDAGLAPSGSFTDGEAVISVVTGIRRAAPDNPDGPYAGTQFGIAPNDNDPNPASGVQMGSFDLDVDNDATNDHFAVAPTTELRYGRLRLQNAYGPVTQALPIPLEVQYWNGSSFVVSDDDNCTTLGRGEISLAFTGAIAACDTQVQQASLAFASGTATLTLAAPGAGKTGTVLLTPQLGSAAGTFCPGPAATTASAASYLLGRWDDAANPDADASTSYDDKPSGQAGFGLYGSQPKNFIFFRENY